MGTASTSTPAADIAIATAMASFSETRQGQQQQQPLAATGGQQLTPEQLQQIQEQIEVSHWWYRLHRVDACMNAPLVLIGTIIVCVCVPLPDGLVEV